MPTSHAIGQMTSSRGRPQLSGSARASGMTRAQSATGTVGGQPRWCSPETGAAPSARAYREVRPQLCQAQACVARGDLRVRTPYRLHHCFLIEASVAGTAQLA